MPESQAAVPPQGDVWWDEHKKVKVWWDEKEKVVRHKSWGVDDQKVAHDSSQAILQLLQKHGGPGRTLVDLRDTISVNGKGRKEYADLVKSPLILRCGLFGANTIMRVVANFVFAAVGQADKAKVFATEQEALDWVHAYKP